MKKASFFIIIVISIPLLIGAWKGYDEIYFKKKSGTMTIKCHYMAYACGDCYAQWKIDSSFAVENGLKDLIERNMYVNYKGKRMEESVPDSVSKCIICYDFYFTGSLRKTLSDKHKFEANDFKMELRFKGCCN